MEKRFLQFIFLILGGILIWNLWHPFWRLDLNESVNPSSEETIIFEINKGSSAKTIAKNLDKKDLIVNKNSFLRTVKTEELDQSLRYGRFLLSPNMSLRDVVTILTTEGTGEMAVTIVEGWTVDEIDTKLFDLGLIAEGELRLCTFNCEFDYEFLDGNFGLEGYLFPDTYFIDSSTFNAEGFIDLMLSNFDKKFTQEMRDATKANGRTINDTIIVASMIEREVRTEKDIPIVGGIIWKRLDNDWALGIDATLLYVQDDNELTAEDLAEDSPYNTRINTGLTPSAISNPGLASLEGAAYPEDSDYWFYLTTLDTGEVIYGVTNDDHNNNKAKYLQ
jgi:UPF0755 protein